ncbi:MAG: LysE family translocator [Jaaginema sp. PMC 1079.18]|nr:LysE family translocator [Jaaginema sp. PMC 1080.18]MEC4852791.1 LysE family translocator [Jaaginema sp. PMC 1079.18]MEC4868282.1 LysE family translocator [Jaaginema sp. PMC 1078.18]
MNLSTIITLLGAMVVLAAIPSVSVLMVITRSVTGGFKQGCYTTLGIVLGDLIFIIIALQGLALFAQHSDTLFLVIKYLGAAYLSYLGIRLLRSKPQKIELQESASSSNFASFLAGLSLTLADQKAIFFYLGFFPAFLDLTLVTGQDILIIVVITILAVGGVKLIYALMATKAQKLSNSQVSQNLYRIAGLVMIIIALLLLFKT